MEQGRPSKTKCNMFAVAWIVANVGTKPWVVVITNVVMVRRFKMLRQNVVQKVASHKMMKIIIYINHLY